MPYKDPELRKACIRKAVKSWKQAHPEKVSEHNRTYTAKNAVYFIDSAKNWARNNRAARNESQKRREMGKLHRTPKWLSEFDKLKIKCIYSIAAMLTRENKEQWHVDHIIPLQGKNVCGLHVPSNLWFIRGVDNLNKSNKFKG
jgi:hypothetical protein